MGKDLPLLYMLEPVEVLLCIFVLANSGSLWLRSILLIIVLYPFKGTV